jgi:hypothetical protein
LLVVQVFVLELTRSFYIPKYAMADSVATLVRVDRFENMTAKVLPVNGRVGVETLYLASTLSSMDRVKRLYSCSLDKSAVDKKC